MLKGDSVERECRSTRSAAWVASVLPFVAVSEVTLEFGPESMVKKLTDEGWQ